MRPTLHVLLLPMQWKPPFSLQTKITLSCVRGFCDYAELVVAACAVRGGTEVGGRRVRWFRPFPKGNHYD